MSVCDSSGRQHCKKTEHAEETEGYSLRRLSKPDGIHLVLSLHTSCGAGILVRFLGPDSCLVSDSSVDDGSPSSEDQQSTCLGDQCVSEDEYG